MPVLTHKEYSTRDIRKKLDTPHVAGRRGGGEFTPPPVAPAIPVAYVLQYPEIPSRGEPPSFDTMARIGKEEVAFSCQRGVVRTQNEALMSYLTKQGYLLLEKRSIA